MRVLLLNPPSESGTIYMKELGRCGRKSVAGELWPQTGLAYLAAVARGRGCEALIEESGVHVEIEADTVPNWNTLSAYRDALEGALGAGAAEKLAADCAAQMKAMNEIAERIYINWMQTAAKAGPG